MTASAEPRIAIVPESAAGRRLDAVLAELFPDFSRSRLTEWVKAGDALLEMMFRTCNGRLTAAAGTDKVGRKPCGQPWATLNCGSRR